MSDLTSTNLQELGSDAAVAVAGMPADDVVVRYGEDSTGAPAYFFFFVFDDQASRDKVGALRSALGQRVRDSLISQHDDVYPYIQVLNRAGWEKLGV